MKWSELEKYHLVSICWAHPQSYPHIHMLLSDAASVGNGIFRSVSRKLYLKIIIWWEPASIVNYIRTGSFIKWPIQMEMCDFLTLKILPLALELIETKKIAIFLNHWSENAPFTLQFRVFNRWRQFFHWKRGLLTNGS